MIKYTTGHFETAIYDGILLGSTYNFKRYRSLY